MAGGSHVRTSPLSAMVRSHRTPSDSPRDEIGIRLGADDEETLCSVQREQTLEVHMATIHDVEGAGLRDQQNKDIDVV